MVTEPHEYDMYVLVIDVSNRILVDASLFDWTVKKQFLFYSISFYSI